jgi:hypothetical protein
MTDSPNIQHMTTLLTGASAEQLREKICAAMKSLRFEDNGVECHVFMHLMPWNVVRINHKDSRMKMEVTMAALRNRSVAHTWNRNFELTLGVPSLT